MRWQVLVPQVPANVTELTEWLLANRSVTDQAAFLQPPSPLKLSLEQVKLDPVVMQTAVDRLQVAIKNQEKVLIFGDYDVDGISATAIAWEALKAAGLVAKPFIPHRLKHGYGLSIKALDELLAKERPDLVLTVDNGIVAHEALARLKQENIPVIVTDHHQPDDQSLPTLATVHTTVLCGAGVAWFLARELVGEKASQWLDLVAMATVADQMPLLGVNRALVVHGLPLLRQGTRPGLKALLATTNIEGKNLTAEQLSFSLIPRLNAMGRLADGVDSLRLLCIQSPQRAAELAQKLQETNVARQDLTHDLLEVAVAQAELQTDQKILVVASAEFHEGVIGLLAGKLLEKYTKPVVAIHLGETLAKASVRSLPGVNIIELLRQMKTAFWELGGHALAAGFACDPVKIDDIREQLIQLAAANVRPDQLEPVLTADCQLTGKWLTVDLLNALATFQPFGQANPKPSFHFENLTITEISVVGKAQQHLRLGLQFETGEKIIAMAWQKAQRAGELKLGQKIELIAMVEANVWRERTQVQLIVSDWKLIDS